MILLTAYPGPSTRSCACAPARMHQADRIAIANTTHLAPPHLRFRWPIRNPAVLLTVTPVSLALIVFPRECVIQRRTNLYPQSIRPAHRRATPARSVL